MPRPPMSRLPTELTSSIPPCFTLIFWLPGSTTFSGLTAVVGAGVSPPTGVVPGAGCLSGDLGCFTSGEGCLAAGVSPPTGVVPGAGWAVGVSAGGVLAGVADGVDCAHAIEASISASPARVIALEPLKPDLITQPPGEDDFQGICRFAVFIRRRYRPIWHQDRRIFQSSNRSSSTR